MICIPIVAQSMGEARRQLAAAPAAGADLVELRLDYLREQSDPGALLRASPLPVIATCRAAREGGRWGGGEEERLRLLAQAAAAGAEYVDVEADCVAAFTGAGKAKVIASRHDFSQTPADLARFVAGLEELPCHAIKFAVTATDLRDNLRVFELLQRCRKPAIGLCMGELGEVSRVLGLRYGSLLTFGSLESGKESAPGQIPAADLKRLYRVREITAATALYAVAGNPIAHSLSPEIHNTAFRELGLDAAYLKFRVGDFPVFLREVAEPLGLRGLSVTIPHKEAALAASAEAGELARRIGAVNTLTRRLDGKWRGYNTDCEAALAAIRRAAERAGQRLKGCRALLLGAGGTARAVGFGLRQAGCAITVANRTRARAAELAAELGAEAAGLEELAPGRFDLIANTTSVGMYPQIDASPVAAELFRPGMAAFDAVYNPRLTRLLREARERGAEIAGGVEMFAGQAVRQFELWTGRPAPRAAMEEVVERRLAK